MALRFLLASAMGCVLCGSALAQAPAVPSAATPPAGMPQGGVGLRAGNIAESGQTVPNPRTLPTAPRTSVDRPLGDEDAGRRDYGICKGC